MKSLLSILIVLIIPIFGMSGDVDNEPPIQNSDTEKDSYGIDTGLTHIQLEELKKQYHKKLLDKMDIYQAETKSSKKPLNSSRLWNYKFNIDAWVELKRHMEIPYLKNCLYSDVVVIGFGQLKKRENSESFVEIKIDEILKGREIIKNNFNQFPEVLKYGAIGVFDSPGHIDEDGQDHTILECTRFSGDLAKHIFLPFSRTQPDSYIL
jgi:hypothetical protein